ncbi:Fungal transcriptional regulatory [Cordyceps militaris]|uniref:Fungal transcriptional regulatory n=1 Tax=Cordyceps militaris TaxID=73501 RepID=A0A2H4SWF3_CORMI|nr:Fungal transcriptional regulatory [Cordyceps militaris]
MSPGSPESSPAPASQHSRSTTDEPARPPSKRQRQNDACSTAPQRRQAACQPCRLRKIKCDKKRPACTICDAGGHNCKYLEEGAEKLTLETVTTTLLQKFEYLSAELASLRDLVESRDHGPAPCDPPPQIIRPAAASGQTAPVLTPAVDASQSAEPLEPSRDFLQIPQHPASADTVLRWEIFEDKFPANALISSLFKPNSDATDDMIIAPSRLTPLDEEAIPSLIDRFLQNVHTKNPILDVEALVKHGRRCADQGIGWDDRSCLVLLACALGSIVKPFGMPLPKTTNVYWGTNHSVRTSIASSSKLYARELQLADSCFALACRRIGSLKYSLLGAQCHFFAGVYLMYTLRPLASWHYFLHASVFFQVHVRMTHGIAGDLEEALNGHSNRSNPATRKSKRLEQSLYWSAFKSECEFRVELPLQQSEISLAEYPDLFPSPPSPIPDNLGDDRSTDGHTSINAEELELRQHAVRLCNEEESWYYYLTEIALRRIGNRIVNTFFRQGRSAWIMNLKPLLRMAKEFEAQVSSWSAHLPPAMQNYETASVIRAPQEGTSNHVTRELSWAVDNRLLEMQTWLYQPFLFYFIHVARPNLLRRMEASRSTEPSITSLLNSPPATAVAKEGFESINDIPKLDDVEVEMLNLLVASGIDCCLKTIDVRSKGHRHHGLWYDLRSIMTASLILLAIIKSGQAAWIPGGADIVWGTPPGQYWQGSQDPIGGKIGKVLTQFEFWAAESPDLVHYRDILEHLVREIRGSYS